MLVSKTKENHRLVAYMKEGCEKTFLKANKKTSWGYLTKNGFLTNKGIIIPTWIHSSEKLYDWE